MSKENLASHQKNNVIPISPHAPTEDSPLGILIKRMNAFEKRNEEYEGMLVAMFGELVKAIECNKLSDPARVEHISNASFVMNHYFYLEGMMVEALEKLG